MIKITNKGAKAWVTFTYTPDEGVERVDLCGEWSDWKDEAMKQKKNGDFSITKVIKTGENYEFGYKIDGEDWAVEAMCPVTTSPFYTENSILEL